MNGNKNRAILEENLQQTKHRFTDSASNSNMTGIKNCCSLMVSLQPDEIWANCQERAKKKKSGSRCVKLIDLQL